MAFRGRIVRISQLLADKLVGALIMTAETGARVVMSSAGPGFTFFTGDPGETAPGELNVGSTFMQLRGPDFGGGQASITMHSTGAGNDIQLVTASGVSIGNLGSPIKELRFGLAQVHHAASLTGTLNQPHGLGGGPPGSAPTFAGAFCGQVTANVACATPPANWDATNIRIDTRRVDGGAAFTGDVPVMWWALR